MSTATLRERFIRRLQPTEDCVIWTGCIDEKGYGRIGIGRSAVRAHRAAWFLKHGEWPAQQIMHTCDNRRCVRISHLRLSTQAENLKDMRDKGRGTRGEKVHTSKLTCDDVREIRRLCSEDVPQREVAQRFGVSLPIVSGIYRRRAWKHVDPAEAPERKMKRVIIAGEKMSVAEASRRFGLSIDTIYGRLDRGLTGEDIIRPRFQAPRKPYTLKAPHWRSRKS